MRISFLQEEVAKTKGGQDSRSKRAAKGGGFAL